jgi:hypothetical protein
MACSSLLITLIRKLAIQALVLRHPIMAIKLSGKSRPSGLTFFADFSYLSNRTFSLHDGLVVIRERRFCICVSFFI